MTEAASPGVLQSLGLNWQLFLAQLINFSLVLYVVWRWIYRPLLKIMDARSKKIEQGLANAEAAKKQLAEADTQRKNIAQAARKEGQRLVEEARKKAEQEKGRVMAETEVSLDIQLNDARARLKHEKEAVIGAIKNEMADLISQATEKVAMGAVDQTKQRDLIKQALQDMNKEV